MKKQKFKINYFIVSSNDWLYILLIIVGAILFRLILITKAYAIGYDEVNYLKLAASCKIYGFNHVLHTYWPPFYPIMVSLFSFIFKSFELAGRMVSIFFGSIIILPVFIFIKENFNKKIAYGTSLLIAFYPYWAIFGIHAETEALYSFCAISGIIIGWNIIAGGKPSWTGMLVGMFFGLAYLTRPEGIGFLIVYLSIIGIVGIKKIIAKQDFARFGGIILFALIGFIIISTPYLYYLHSATGTWTISAKYSSNQQGEMYVMNKNKFNKSPFYSLSNDNKELLQDEIYHIGNFVKKSHQVKKTIVSISISNLIKKISKNIYIILTESLTKILTVFLLILIGLGLFVDPWTKKDIFINLYLMSFIVFFWFILIPFFHISLRYFVPLLPISFIWVSKGAFNLINWFDNTFKKNLREKSTDLFWIKKLSIAIVIILIMLISIIPELGKYFDRDMYSTDEWAPCIEQKRAGLWLKNNGIKNPIIMSENHAVSFYAGNYNIKDSVTIPHEPINRILAYAKYRGVDYIVLNDRYRDKYPTIKYLLDQKNISPQLKLIYYDKDKNGLRTLIYQIRKK